jgi:hypothetical protein
MRTVSCVSHVMRFWGVFSFVVLSCGCQGLNIGTSSGGGGSTLQPSDKIVVWQDPANQDSKGTNIRDVNNDAERFVVIGTGGEVQFVHGTTFLVARDVTANLNDASFNVGNGTIDIRFGLAPGETTDRRPFLVDRNTGHLIQLVGGTTEVTFQVTDTAFEDPNDPTNDRAVQAGETDNPLAAAASPNTPTTNALNRLCGIGGAGMIPVILLGLVGLRFARRRRL